MAIRDVVTGGLGNGSFSSTIAFLAIDGFSVGDEAVTVIGVKWVAGEVYLPGFKEGDIFKPDFIEGDLFKPGFQEGEVI